MVDIGKGPRCYFTIKRKKVNWFYQIFVEGCLWENLCGGGTAKDENSAEVDSSK